MGQTIKYAHDYRDRFTTRAAIQAASYGSAEMATESQFPKAPPLRFELTPEQVADLERAKPYGTGNSQLALPGPSKIPKFSPPPAEL
jgi:hypothetical protein